MNNILIDLSQPNLPALHQVGGKAFNLSKLFTMGMPVPMAFVIPISIHTNSDKIDLEELRHQILEHIIVNSGISFAVRSSGVGEDNQDNSCAGIFETYLYVSREEIYDSILKVWDSINSSRSKAYSLERNVTIDSMAVIVQHMVDAEYAGVAFSVCPIEKDQRIMLLEIVKGNGDSLVSGRVTPASIRINKLTGMIRVSRRGADNLSETTLKTIAQKVTPFIRKIEQAYGIPVDVEWAISEGEVKILQARPITA